jgi:hypothetical protein
VGGVGITDFNVTTAYNQMRANALTPQPRDSRGNLDSYIAYGYVPLDANDRGTCDTLAYAYNDWAIAELAGLIGRTEDVPAFSARALNYRNVFSADDTFMCPRYIVRARDVGGPRRLTVTHSPTHPHMRPHTHKLSHSLSLSLPMGGQNGTFMCPRVSQYMFSQYYVEGSAWSVRALLLGRGRALCPDGCART